MYLDAGGTLRQNPQLQSGLWALLLSGLISWGVGGMQWGLHCPALLTPELSVLMALTCRQSSTAWLVLLASAVSSGPRPPGSALASLSPFSLSRGARRCTSLRCFLVT